jgi:hypothetical protein
LVAERSYSQRSCRGFSRILNTFAGTPPTIVFSGTSLVSRGLAVPYACERFEGHRKAHERALAGGRGASTRRLRKIAAHADASVLLGAWRLGRPESCCDHQIVVGRLSRPRIF